MDNIERMILLQWVENLVSEVKDGKISLDDMEKAVKDTITFYLEKEEE